MLARRIEDDRSEIIPGRPTRPDNPLGDGREVGGTSRGWSLCNGVEVAGAVAAVVSWVPPRTWCVAVVSTPSLMSTLTA